jgi:hypothetical protein
MPRLLGSPVVCVEGPKVRDVSRPDRPPRDDRARPGRGLALIAPGRVDILDRVAGIVARSRRRDQVTVDWPRKATQLVLLARARRVMVGDVTLVGPNGLRVEQVRVSWPGQRPRRRCCA